LGGQRAQSLEAEAMASSDPNIVKAIAAAGINLSNFIF
jgi:hypothetical protein